ncbi:hypothetical protein D046_0169, partial [Vibrio parahaemolyticus V-223/04]
MHPTSPLSIGNQLSLALQQQRSLMLFSSWLHPYREFRNAINASRSFWFSDNTF